VIYFKRGILVKKGQSVIEYVIIFAILTALSLIFMQKIPKIFEAYVTNAAEKME